MAMSNEAEMLRMIGLSFRKIGRIVDKSHTVVEAVVKGRPAIYSKDTEKKIWEVINKAKAEAGKKLRELRKAA